MSDVDISRERLERLRSFGSVDYLHIALRDEVDALTRERDDLRTMLGEWLRPYDDWSDAELSKRVDPATEKRVKESSTLLGKTHPNTEKETG